MLLLSSLMAPEEAVWALGERLSPHIPSVCYSLDCLLWNPGQGAGDGLYFFGGILLSPSRVTLCIPLMPLPNQRVVLQQSYWLHEPRKSLSSTLF